MPKVTVRNTFIEFEDDAGDLLDDDHHWGRALTEPVKVLPNADEVATGGRFLDSADQSYFVPAPGQAPGQRKDTLQTLTTDPELAQIFEDIRLHGAKALIRYYHDEALMRRISQKTGKLPFDLRQIMKPAPSGEPQFGGNGNGNFNVPIGPDAPASTATPQPVANNPLRCGDASSRDPNAALVQGAPLRYGMPQMEQANGWMAAAQQMPPKVHSDQLWVQQDMQGPEQGTAQGLAPADVSLITKAVASMDEALMEDATLEAIRSMQCSVTLADPSLPDCPLIGCSAGFETLTGYSRAEALGRNCRFLNKGNVLDPSLRRTLQQAVQNGTEFIGVLPNTRKNGEVFKNLLHMTTLQVRGRRYIIGVQADVDNITLDLRNPRHLQELELAASRIFAGNIDAWVQIQEREYAMRLPVPCSDILKANAPQLYTAAQKDFVSYKIEHIEKEKNVDEGALECSATVSTVEGEHEDHWNSRQTSSDTALPAEPENPGGLKSIGSKGHPDSCGSECIFFFFRGACRAGAQCLFCHEYHPRKNAKKNRRVMRRILANTQGSGNDAAAGEASVADAQDPEEETSGGQAPQVVSAANNATIMALLDRGADEGKLLVLRYGPEKASSAQVTIVTGQAVELKPSIEFIEEGEFLRQRLAFTVEPPLPAGLVLNPHTGTITGSSNSSQAAAKYVITVSTRAVGHQGVPLGHVPLDLCALTISVVDLRSFSMVWGSEQDGRLVLQYAEGSKP